MALPPKRDPSKEHKLPPERKVPNLPRLTDDTDREEITKIIDTSGMYRKLEKLDGLMQKTSRFVSEIPEVKDKVNATGDKVIELKAQIGGLDTRVIGLERRMERPHDCYQIDIISRLSEREKQSSATLEESVLGDIKVAEKINYIERDVTDIKGSKKWLIGVMVGLLFPVLGSIGSAIWLAASLSEKVEAQEQLQRQGINQVKSAVVSSSQRHAEALQTLDKQIELSNKTITAAEIKQQDWYKKLPDSDKRRLDVVLLKGLNR